MNSIVATTMSACAMSARQRSSAAGCAAQSEAACWLSTKPGSRRRRATRARSVALARCVSIVTMTTRYGVGSRVGMGEGMSPI